MIKNETEYEINQRFNTIVSWLHSYRYKNIQEVIEEFSASNNTGPIRIIDIGCAHAKLYSILNDKFKLDYIGIDPNADYVHAAQERYQGKPNFRIINDTAEKQLHLITDADIVVALETFEHVPEHIVVRIVEEIAKTQPKLFICSVPVEVGPAIWIKNLGSLASGYMRHTEYTWKETFWAGVGRLDKLPPHGTGHKGFDWRWLAQTIRHNMQLKEMRKFPFRVLPAWLSTSVFFIAEPRQT
ncbi:MAG: class I SAM-dependent methyltransferase [Candidatus Thiodiazotropha sp.]